MLTSVRCLKSQAIFEEAIFIEIPASVNFLFQMLSKMAKKIYTNRGLVLNFAL